MLDRSHIIVSGGRCGLTARVLHGGWQDFYPQQWARPPGTSILALGTIGVRGLREAGQNTQ